MYSICVIDVGSPKLGNLGWCVINTQTNLETTGVDLDILSACLGDILQTQSVILGFEAPLFAPLRPDIMMATKARRGEGRRPWSAGAGAQVLALNLPIMMYCFNALKRSFPNVDIHIDDTTFLNNLQNVKSGSLMIFEALVSGTDKGDNHIHDAQIMARSCARYAARDALPPSILEHEDNVEYFNIAGAGLLRAGLSHDVGVLRAPSPIYKPTSI